MANCTIPGFPQFSYALVQMQYRIGVENGCVHILKAGRNKNKNGKKREEWRIGERWEKLVRVCIRQSPYRWKYELKEYIYKLTTKPRRLFHKRKNSLFQGSTLHILSFSTSSQHVNILQRKTAILTYLFPIEICVNKPQK